MRIHHLNCGCLCPLGGRLWDDWSFGVSAKLVCHCWLLEHHDGLTLVDTGLGTRDVAAARRRISPIFRALNRPRLDEDDSALRQIERLGFRADDVKHVVMTHLDFDHAGGVADFPGARVHVSSTEYAAALSPSNWRDRRRYRPAQWGGPIKWSLHDLPARPASWFNFPAMPLVDVPGEVLMIPLPGHTKGHVGVAVKTRRSWMLHAGDAYFNRGEISGRRYRCPPATRANQWFMEVHRGDRLLTQRRLRHFAGEHADQLRIFSSHDAVELIGVTGKPDLM